MTEASERPVELHSKKYSFTVHGSMPVLDFEISPGSALGEEGQKKELLTLELYNPASGALFEAKFPKGRIEVDLDGSLTYFSTKTDSLNLSLFLGRNLTLSLDKKSGQVSIRTPSKIVSLHQDIQSASKRRRKKSEVTTDSITFKLD